MKHLVLLIVFIVTLMFAEAEVPSFIKTCKQDDPQISKCIINSIEDLRPRLVAGIPSLDIPPIDPLSIRNVALEFGNGFAASLQNLEIQGIKNFEIRNLTVDLKAHEYHMIIFIPEFKANGTCDIDAAIGSIPLKGKGPIKLVGKSVTGRGILHGKKVSSKGKTRFFFPSMILKLEVGDYKLNLENLFEGDPTFGEATNKLLNDEKTEVLKSILPGIEKAVIEKALGIGNHICEHFTWEELFPSH